VKKCLDCEYYDFARDHCWLVNGLNVDQTVSGDDECMIPGLIEGLLKLRCCPNCYGHGLDIDNGPGICNIRGVSLQNWAPCLHWTEADAIEKGKL
jgi:hypothetical protein